MSSNGFSSRNNTFYHYFAKLFTFGIKVRKKAKVTNPYNQIPHPLPPSGSTHGSLASFGISACVSVGGVCAYAIGTKSLCTGPCIV